MAKIPWSQIREAFEGQWVELTDYSWKPESVHPHAAKVRHFSESRNELLSMIARSGSIEGAVVLFVGPAFPGIYTTQHGSFASNF